MQVSEVHDHVTHAIIGGEESIDFGISNSAEFFHILSSTLYNDQKLAVVREVMCNAWDEHIAGGIEDTPIRITVNQNEFIVQDFGRGIHKDDIGPIYGVYGNSTKKNDGKQTGGFGLGCKSPFAYTDHFEVTSSHDGTKTIYRMSKAAVQSGAKPGIFPIVSLPTEETGLIVKIALKPADYPRFLELAKRIARNGEMNAEINGTVQPRLGFDPTIRPYMIFQGISLMDAKSAAIYIRYGNVIYPCDSWPQELESLVTEIRHFTKNLCGDRYYVGEYKILFQALPNSLSVTPSRESLSMQEHTVKTLKTLFVNFLADVEKYFKPACEKFAESSVEACVKDADYGHLLCRDLSLPNVERISSTGMFSSFEEMAAQVMSNKYPKDVRFRKKDWERRITLMAANKLIDQGMAHTWLGYAKTVTKLNEDYNWNFRGSSEWLGKRVIAPLLTKLNMDSTMDRSKLYCIESIKCNSYRGTGTVDRAVPAVEANLKHHFDTAPYLRNIIVLARRRNNVFERAAQHPTLTKFGKYHGFLFYHVGMKQEDAVNARAFFAKTRMTVIDLIDKQEWEVDHEADLQVYSAAKKEAKPRKKGLVALSYLLDSSKSFIRTDSASDEDAARIEKPEFVIRLFNGVKDPKSSFGGFSPELCRDIAIQFGDRGGLTFSEDQRERYTKKGATDLVSFLLDRLIEYFVANEADIEKYWATHANRVTIGHVELEDKEDQLFRIIQTNSELAAEYKLIKHELDILGKFYLRLYDHLSGFGSVKQDQRFIDLQSALNSISLDPSIVALRKKLDDNKLIRMLDLYYLERDMTAHNKAQDKTHYNKIVEFVKTVVNS